MTIAGIAGDWILGPSKAEAQASWQITPATPHLIAATASGSTPANVRSLAIQLSSDFTGTIDGQTVTGATVTRPLVWYSAGEHPLAAIAYTRTAGTIFIAYSK